MSPQLSRPLHAAASRTLAWRCFSDRPGIEVKVEVEGEVKVEVEVEVEVSTADIFVPLNKLQA